MPFGALIRKICRQEYPEDNQMVNFYPAIWLFINHLDLTPFYLNCRLQNMDYLLSLLHR